MTNREAARKVIRHWRNGNRFGESASLADRFESELDAAERRGEIKALEWVREEQRRFSGSLLADSVERKLAELKAAEAKR